MFKSFWTNSSTPYWGANDEISVWVMAEYARVEIWDPMYSEPHVKMLRGELRDRFIEDLKALEAAGDLDLLTEGKAEDHPEWVDPNPPEPEPELDLDKMERLREAETSF